MSKIMEKVIQKQLREHLDKYKIIPTTQSGFRPGHSCCTALLNITDEIFKSIDQGNLTILTLLDFSKAFDSINHQLLNAILHFVGLSQQAINLLADYIALRSQAVIVDGRSSSFMNLTCGVPQGSILGPLLFLVYTSSFVDICMSASSYFYADDGQLKLSFKPSESSQAVAALNYDLSNVYDISRKHCLHLNKRKSLCQLFGKKNDKNRFLEAYGRSLVMNGEIIGFKDTARNLGLMMDSDMRFTQHISNCLSRAYLSLRLLYQFRNYLSSSIKIVLCESLVLSHLNYCDVIYNPCLTVFDINRVQVLQNSCLRFIYGIRKYEPITYTLKRTGWLNMKHRRNFHSLVLFYRIIKERSPSYLYNKIVLRSSVHSVDVRSRYAISVPRHVTAMFTRSFSYQVPSLMNKLKFDYSRFGLDKFKLHILNNFCNDPLYN